MEEEKKNIPVVDNTVVEDNVPEPETSAPETKPAENPKTEEPEQLETPETPPEATPSEPTPEASSDSPSEADEPLVASASNALPKAETKFAFNSADLKVPDSPLATPAKAKKSCRFATVLLTLLALLGLGFGGYEYYIHEIVKDPRAETLALLSDPDSEMAKLNYEVSKYRGGVGLLESFTRATLVEEDDPDNPGSTMTVAKYLADLAPETSLKSPDFGLALDLPDAASLTSVYTVSPAGEKPNALSGTLALADASGAWLATLYRYYVEPNPEYTFDYAGTCDVIIGEVGSVQIIYNYCVQFSDNISEDLKSALSDPKNYYQL